MMMTFSVSRKATRSLLLYCLILIITFGESNGSSMTLAFGNIPTTASRKKNNIIATTTKTMSLALLLSASTTFTFLQQPAWAGDITKGEQLFINNCASCHIDGTNLINEQRTLKQDALEKFGIGLDQPNIQTFVTNSMRHKNLVYFKVDGGKLNSEQWEDVTTYISDQATNDKW